MQKLFILILFIFGGAVAGRAQGISFDHNNDTAVHNFKLNFIVGVSQGINGAEIGCFVNIDRKNVRYVQMAGFGNIVGGSMYGCQLAGFVNTSGGTMTGLQAAGFGNYSGKNVRGLQASGFFNYGRDFTGIQAAGFSNYAHKTDGLQAAGFVNYAKSIKGIQASGGVNYSDSACTGLQAAGISNTCQVLNGLQAAGLVNYARKVTKGLQVAPFNFADSSNGIPIGVFSFVRQGGYHKLELSSDELFYANAALRTGVSRFYNIFTIGVRPQNVPSPLWTFGYGIGTAIPINSRMDVNIDATANRINYGGYAIYRYFSENYKLYAGVDYHFSKGISIAAGPTLNFYAVNTQNTDLLNSFGNIALPYIYDQPTIPDHELKVWVGGKVAVRFF